MATARSKNGREPPSTNRGVTKTNEKSDEARPPTHCIDWLQYSVPWQDEDIVGAKYAFMPHDALQWTGERVNPRKGYDTAYLLTHGRVSYHSTRPQQKVGVTFTGSDLGSLYEEGVDALDLLAYAIEKGAKVSRLDFAVDFYGEADVMDLWHAWQADELDTRVRTANRIEGSQLDVDEAHQGATVYLGSIDADKRLCVYNKAAEQGVEGPWTRIELRLKNEQAQRVVNAMLDEGVGAAGKTATRDFVQAKLGWYCEALEGEDVYLAPVGRKDTKTRLWLENDVLPVLERELAKCLAENDWRLYDAYMGVLAKVAKTTPKNGKARNPEHAPNRREDGTRVFA